MPCVHLSPFIKSGLRRGSSLRGVAYTFTVLFFWLYWLLKQVFESNCYALHVSRVCWVVEPHGILTFAKLSVVKTSRLGTHSRGKRHPSRKRIPLLTSRCDCFRTNMAFDFRQISYRAVITNLWACILFLKQSMWCTNWVVKRSFTSQRWMSGIYFRLRCGRRRGDEERRELCIGSSFVERCLRWKCLLLGSDTSAK